MAFRKTTFHLSLVQKAIQGRKFSNPSGISNPDVSFYLNHFSTVELEGLMSGFSKVGIHLV